MSVAEVHTGPLTVAEVAWLERLEAVVEEGRKTFIEVGNALMEIRNARLYRKTHKTFEDYCRIRWGFSKSHANRLVDASEVAAIVAPIGVIPANEAQARELVPLLEEPTLMNEAWKEAVATTNGHPTAADVKTAVKRRVISEDERQEILTLRRQGKQIAEIAAKTGWSPASISKITTVKSKPGRMPKRQQAGSAQTRVLAKIHQACREWENIGDEDYIPAPELARRIRILDSCLNFLNSKRDTYKEVAPNGSRSNART